MEVDHSKQFKTVLLLYFYVFCHMQYDFHRNANGMNWNLLTAIFENGLYAFNSLQFVVPVYFIYVRLQVLNKVLRAVQTSCESEISFPKVQALTYELLHIVQLINESFGFQMLVTSISYTLVGVFSVFAMFEAFVFNIEVFRNIALLLIYFGAFDVIILILTCTLTSLISKEVK